MDGAYDTVDCAEYWLLADLDRNVSEHSGEE
jgi:hypothetical protein